MVCALIAGTQRDFYTFLTLPYWSLALQLVYLFTVVRISIEKKTPSMNHKESNKITHVIYQIVFSWQLFNVLYFALVLVPQTDFNMDNLGTVLIQVNLNVINFVIMWIEQGFNMMRFNLRHIWFMILGFVFNFILAGMVSFKMETCIYWHEIDFKSSRVIATIFLLVIAPIVHFIIGYFHYEYKKTRYHENRKKLREKLISIKTVDEKEVYEFYGGC